MATAADIIKGALRRIQVIGSETAIEPDEIADGLEDLNDFGSQNEVGVVALGFTQLSDTGDTVSIPIEAVGYFKDHLAIYMAGQYGAPVSQSLMLSAENSQMAVLNAFQPIIDVEFPDTLPMGSGNDCDQTIEDQRFFDSNSIVNF